MGKSNKIITILSALLITVSFSVFAATASSTREADSDTSVGDSYDYHYCDLEDTEGEYSQLEHYYTMTGGPDEGYEYWSSIKRFRIYLMDDFVENADLDNLKCSTRSATSTYVNCDGGTYYNEATQWVEVTLHLESRGDTIESDAEYPNYIEWEYDYHDTNTPVWLPGYNTYEDDGTDSYDWEDRTISEWVMFKWSDSAEDGDTATSESGIKMDNWICNEPDCEDLSDYEEIEDVWGNLSWHWNTHTTPATVEYVCEELFCADLEMLPDALTAEEAEGRINVTIDDNPATDGTDWEDAPDFAGYKYWALNSAGTTSSGTFRENYLSTYPGDTGNPLETDDTSVYYYNGTAGDVLYSCAVDSRGNCLTVANGDPYDCKDQVTSESAPIFCFDLEMLPDTVTQDEADETITVSIDDNPATDGTDWEDADDFAGYRYWALNAAGTTSSGTFREGYWYPMFGHTGNPLETTDTEVYFYNGAEGDTIHVCAIDSSGNCITVANGYPYDCQDLTSSPVCEDLEITQPAVYDDSSYSTSCFDVVVEEYNTDGTVRNEIVCYEAYDETTGVITTTGTFTDSEGNTAIGTLCTEDHSVTYCNGTEGDAIYTYDQSSTYCDDSIDYTPGTTPDDDTPDDDTPDDDTPDDDTPDDDTPDDDTPGDDDDDTPGDDDDDDDDDDVPPQTTNEGNLTKEAESYNFYTDAMGITGYYHSDSVTLAHNLDFIYYTLTYTAGSSGEAVIEDELSTDIIGYMSDGSATSSSLYYERESFTISVPECAEDMIIPCYELTDTGNPLAGITLMNLTDGSTVTITYTARVDSYLDCDSPPENVCLAEYFTNHATAQEADGFQLSAETTATVICPYLLTRNAGDVYLENELMSGTSIVCVAENDFANSDGVVMVKEQPSLTLEDVLNNFSSYIKEMFYTAQNDWLVSEIIDNTQNHIARGTYNYQTMSPVTTSMTIYGWSDLEQLRNSNDPDENVYYFDGTDITDASLTLSELTVPKGAHTIIVKNADLYLNWDIQYEDANFGFNYYMYSEDADYSDLASLAIIVLGEGDIYVSHNVSDLVGVYYIENGSMKSAGDVERNPIGEQLRIYGSVYGDMDPIIQKSGFVGPPELDHGSIVIRYDERIILNTPPFISEYVVVYSEKTAR